MWVTHRIYDIRGTSFAFLFSLDEPGFVHFIMLLSKPSSPPTSAAVKSGTSPPGVVMFRYGTLNCTVAFQSVHTNFTGLSADTHYWIYAVAEDDPLLNLQASPWNVTVQTLDITPPVINYFTVSPSQSSLVMFVSMSETGKTYYVLQPWGTATPNKTNVLNGLAAGGVPAAAAGAITFYSPGVLSVSATGLSYGTRWGGAG